MYNQSTTAICRTRNYIAFDGDESYMSYLNMLRWSDASNHDLSINDAHELNTARDDSLPASIINQLKPRLDRSKNMVLIVDDAVKYNRKGILTYEINYALRNKIPIILAFKGYSTNDHYDNEMWVKNLLPKVPIVLKDAPKENKYVRICPMTLSVINDALRYTSGNLPECGFVWHWR